MPSSSGPLIKSLHIKDLFGKRTYDVEIPNENGLVSPLLLLHGDNGSGKTTLLRLVWNTLSPAHDRGHRTFIAQTPFSNLRIVLAENTVITVFKNDGLLGDFTIRVARTGVEDIVVPYISDDNNVIRGRSRFAQYEDIALIERYASKPNVSRRDLQSLNKMLEKRSNSGANEEKYIRYLDALVKTPLFLADDRSLYSDDPEIDRIRAALSREDDHERRDRLSRLVFLELQVTLNRVNDVLRSLTIGGQNDGSANTNTIYTDFLRELAHSRGTDQQEDISSTQNLLKDIAHRAPGFERYGLVPRFSAGEFSALISEVSGTEMTGLAYRVVQPYVASLAARYDALSEAHSLLDALIPSINNFFHEKELTFSPRQGLTIVGSDGSDLGVEALSSGERQLVMLLCTTLLAGREARLFIIDEPELSLGVQWQRDILDVLLRLTKDTQLQFLIATHSIEIISGHPDSLVQLRQKANRS